MRRVIARLQSLCASGQHRVILPVLLQLLTWSYLCLTFHSSNSCAPIRLLMARVSSHRATLARG